MLIRRTPALTCASRDMSVVTDRVFCKIRPLVIYNITTDIRTAVIHKFEWSRHAPNTGKTYCLTVSSAWAKAQSG
jgi:hypothetical protein